MASQLLFTHEQDILPRVSRIWEIEDGRLYDCGRPPDALLNLAPSSRHQYKNCIALGLLPDNISQSGSSGGGMQDPRIRIAAAAILSVAAFISVQGAVFAFLWWLVFTPGITLIQKIRLVVPSTADDRFFQPCAGTFRREWPFVLSSG